MRWSGCSKSAEEVKKGIAAQILYRNESAVAAFGKGDCE